jgi:alpha-amylase
MFSDIDHKHPNVREDIFNWVQWLSTQMKLGGLRLDAVRHYSGEFLRDLLFYIDKNVDPNWFFVGEYWRDNSKVLARYIEYMGGRISLFDVNLLLNFSKLSLEENADLRTVFEDSLASLKPQNAVVSERKLNCTIYMNIPTNLSLQIFVTNHDTVMIPSVFLFYRLAN